MHQQGLWIKLIIIDKINKLIFKTKKKKNKMNLQEIQIKIEELIIEFREIDKLILDLDLNIIKILNTIYLKDRDLILIIQ